MRPDEDTLLYPETRALSGGIYAATPLHVANPEFLTSEAYTQIDEIVVEVPGNPDAQQYKPFLFQEYAAPVMARLRRLHGVPAEHYRGSFTMASRLIEFASTSKSRQNFFFTEDGLYMVKTQTDAELTTLLAFLPGYMDHIIRNPDSLINKFFGIYRVIDPDSRRSTLFVVTSNVFATRHAIGERYDLKGSTVGRCCSPSKRAKPTTVLKDLDLEESGPIRLARGQKQRLLRGLERDVRFLESLGLMDYSLLVGIYRPRRRRSLIQRAGPPPRWASALGGALGGLVRWAARPVPFKKPMGSHIYMGADPGSLVYVGLIDMLQRYTLLKTLETAAKGLVYDRDGISAVPPDEYAQRFLTFVDRNIA